MDAYKQRLLDAQNDDTRFDGVDLLMRGGMIVKVLSIDFEILVKLRIIFKRMPPINYEMHIDLDMAIRLMKAWTVPVGNEWKNILAYIHLTLPTKPP